MDQKYSVLTNGFDFVIDAANNLLLINEENIEVKGQRRLAKYALLHFSSGVELVLKYRLLCEHWTYIFSDMNKASKNNLESGDFKSVDNVTIIERLENLCGINISDKDKQVLKRVRTARNKMEHFTLDESHQYFEAIVHQGLSVLLKIIAQCFEISQFSEEENEMFTALKTELVRFDKHNIEMKAIATAEIHQMELEDDVLPCPACGEEYFVSTSTCGIKCCFCGHTEYDAEDAANNYMENILGISAYSAIKDGDGFPVFDCPDCDRSSFLYDTKNKEWICFSCHVKYTEQEVSFCGECGQPFLSEEDDICICSNCFEYKISRDD
jgi:ribosomal protein S27AE